MLEFDNSLPTYGGVTIAIVIILFFITSITLSKYNVKKNGYYSVLAWIPFARLYLLGKFTIHKLFGFLLMIGIILSGKIILDVDGVEKTYSFLPENIRIIVFYTTITIETFLFALASLRALSNSLTLFSKSAGSISNNKSPSLT